MKPVSMLLLLLISQAVHAQDAIENNLGMRFVRIPAGEFIMGTDDLATAREENPASEAGALLDETPAHTVVISHAFYMGETEVTQAQWLSVMENRPGPDQVWKRDDWKSLPVVSVSWYMAQRFIEEINKMDDRYRYRLPSEAEWEYVARDGMNALRPVSVEDLQDYAWFISNSADIPHAVASLSPNRYGVYDMLGNAWEWVNDWYAEDTYTNEKRIDPTGPMDGRSKVRRGGSYHCPLHLTRPGYRSANPPVTRYEVLGFRIIAEPRQ
jgi:formylglycine-generating enzyme